MDFLDVLKEKLNPVSVYLMKGGPFGDRTILIVLEEADPEKVGEVLESLDVDYDFAVMTIEEFEKVKESVEESGEKLW